MHTILIFGDIMGRIGREALKKTLPDFRSEYQPDLIIANVENLAHGSGVSLNTLAEMKDIGIDVFTSGNHIFNNKQIFDVLEDEKLSQNLLRPINYPEGTPGKGWVKIEKDGIRYLIINAIGRVFFNENFDDPFRAIDKLLEKESADIILLDFHAEATSEKNTLGLYLDGRITAFWGTHTHVPTADERILPQGTAYISDVGMTGGMNGSLGAKFEPVKTMFLTQLPTTFEPIESGKCEINGIVLKIQNGKTESIERVRKMVKI